MTDKQVLNYIRLHNSPVELRNLSTNLDIPMGRLKEVVWKFIEQGQLEFTYDYLIKSKI